MSEQGQERKERYRRVRTEFDDLDTEDKVLFLMEATVSTVARGVDEFGRAVSDEINKAFSRRAEKREKAADPEEPETSRKGTSSGEGAGSSAGAESTKNKASDAPASDNGSDDTSETL